jgi:hypothetical protein
MEVLQTRLRDEPKASGKAVALQKNASMVMQWTSIPQ